MNKKDKDRIIDNIIEKAMETLYKEPIFSETDFQIKMYNEIQKRLSKKKNFLIIPECSFNFPVKNAKSMSMYIDLMIIYDKTCYPVELKFKTRKKSIKCGPKNEMTYNLKEDGAKNCNCYAYLYDIFRLEKLKEAIIEYKILKNNDSKKISSLNLTNAEFGKGYAIFLTNENYYQKPKDEKTNYYQFSLHEIDNDNNTFIKGKEYKWQKYNFKKNTSKSLEGEIEADGEPKDCKKTFILNDDCEIEYDAKCTIKFNNDHKIHWKPNLDKKTETEDFRYLISKIE